MSYIFLSYVERTKKNPIKTKSWTSCWKPMFVLAYSDRQHFLRYILTKGFTVDACDHYAFINRFIYVLMKGLSRCHEALWIFLLFYSQYGKTEQMAITLAQSLGQNIGIFSDKKRILNGKECWRDSALFPSLALSLISLSSLSLSP